MYFTVFLNKDDDDLKHYITEFKEVKCNVSYLIMLLVARPYLCLLKKKTRNSFLI